MAQPEDATPHATRYAWMVGVIAFAILAYITLNTLTTSPNGSHGIEPGASAPPFAVPLATGPLHGDADVATRANEGGAGRVPACAERGPDILNLCALYEREPVVLALFVDRGACPAVLGDLERLRPAFPQIAFAAVAIRGDRRHVRALIAAAHVRYPVGIDRDGILADLFKDSSCPQLTFVLPGGRVAEPSALGRPSGAALRSEVQMLLERARTAAGAPAA